jgi:hypothetical protein
MHVTGTVRLWDSEQGWGVIDSPATPAGGRRAIGKSVGGALYDAGSTDLEDDPLAWEPVRPAGATMP